MLFYGKKNGTIAGFSESNKGSQELRSKDTELVREIEQAILTSLRP